MEESCYGGNCVLGQLAAPALTGTAGREGADGASRRDASAGPPQNHIRGNQAPDRVRQGTSEPHLGHTLPTWPRQGNSPATPDPSLA